jgi:hypothetical protein
MLCPAWFLERPFVVDLPATAKPYDCWAGFLLQTGSNCVEFLTIHPVLMIRTYEHGFVLLVPVQQAITPLRQIADVRPIGGILSQSHLPEEEQGGSEKGAEGGVVLHEVRQRCWGLGVLGSSTAGVEEKKTREMLS